MLRWTLGYKLEDRKRNEEIREEMRVTDIAGKMRVGRLRYWGHVQRRDQRHVGKKTLGLHVGGKRKRGRPKKTLPEVISQDMVKANVVPGDWANRKEPASSHVLVEER